MPYLKGLASSFDDLINQLCAWATDSAIHGTDAWEVVRNEPWPRGTILRAHGWENGEKQYIGLMPAVIEKGKSYSDWFLSEKIMTSEFAWSINGLGCIPTNDIVTYDPVYKKISVRKRDSAGNLLGAVTYYFSPLPEIFENSGQALFLGVFKQYNSLLNWHEQAGGDRPEIKIKEINFYNSNQTSTPRYPGKFKPPPYPGVGFPAIGMDSSGPLGGLLTFWVTKDRQRMILVTNNGGYWDVAYLGFLEPYHKSTEYTFPATVIGGTSGVVPVGESIFYSDYPSVEFGFRFDYSLKNWSLSHGLPTFAATPWDGKDTWTDSIALSQAQLMLPDGNWQSFSNWAIQKEVISVYTGGDYPAYYFANKEPEQPAGIRHYIRPTYTNTGRTEHIYNSSIADSVSYQLEPLEFVQHRQGSDNIFGRLWRVYWPSSPVYRYGEQLINNKLHLAVPNAWEGRRWHIPHGRTGIVDMQSLKDQDQRINELSRTMNCIIRLED